MAYRISELEGRFAVARLDRNAAVPSWVAGSLTSVTRTREELSIICPEDAVPGDVRAERGFVAFKVEGPLDFSTVGLLAGLTGPLAAAKISVVAFSTYDTDYLLVKAASRAATRSSNDRSGARETKSTPHQRSRPSRGRSSDGDGKSATPSKPGMAANEPSRVQRRP